jgi:nucleotide-binding universal stress UspA family protein
MNRTIVVGTDLTEASDDALIQAEARATRDAVPLVVVHALERVLWGASREDGTFDSIREQVRDRVKALTGRNIDSFEVLVLRGAPHTALARIAQVRDALLIVGSHMERKVGHAFLRDVTERAVGEVRPVWITKPRSGSNRVLVALATPTNDGATLDAAIEEARASGSELVVMHSIHKSFLEMVAADLVNGGAYAAQPIGQRSQVVKARRQLAAELSRRGVEAELHVVDGEPELVIPEVALRTEADLIVVGTPHAPAPISRVATAVLRHAPCSVLVVDSGPTSIDTATPRQAAV